MPRNTKLRKSRKSSARKSKQFTGSSVRNERMPNDGATFTALTAMPRSVTPRPREYSIYQEYSLLNWFTTNVAIETFTSHYVTLGTFNQAATLAALFDQYMISGVEAWLVPNQSAAASASNAGLLFSVIDLDDATNLTNTQQFGEYASCIMSHVDMGHYRHFKPHVAIAAYQGALTAFANRTNQWIDAAYPNTQHYGIKFGASPTPVAVSFNLVVRALIRLRSVH